MAQQQSAQVPVGNRANQAPSWPARLTGAPGVTLAFAWGLAEGTLFFLVPDIIISLAAALNPRRAWKHIVAAALGAVIAGAVMFGWAARDPIAAQRAVGRVPFVSTRMLGRAESQYASRGIGAIFIAPLTGTPYKVYAVTAPSRVSETAFLLATLPARAFRFTLVWALAGLVGTWLRASRRFSSAQILAIHCGAWAVFYGIYWSVI